MVSRVVILCSFFKRRPHQCRTRHGRMIRDIKQDKEPMPIVHRFSSTPIDNDIPQVVFADKRGGEMTGSNESCN